MKKVVVSGYELPTTGQKGSTISWTIDQNHSELLVNNKLINETDEDITATLTAKLVYGDSSIDNINFTVTIKIEIENDYGSYYINIQATSGDALMYELRELITETHTKTTSYDELREYLQDADEDPNNSNNMLMFYTAESITKVTIDGNSTWTREHVWAQSLSWFDDKKSEPAYSDMHHIRPVRQSVNGSRNNTPFGESPGYYNPYNVNSSGSDFRGDVARILFYMFTRYEEADKYGCEIIAESMKILLSWNEIDPVSETEIIRNNYTKLIQGNRNPFIDNPDYADMIWG